MRNKIRQAYIRGMIDLSMFLIMMISFTYFGVYTLEKYFMQEGNYELDIYNNYLEFTVCNFTYR